MRFSRSLLWSMSALVMIGVCAVGASSEWRARIKSIVASETCDNVPCFHLSVRRRVIESVIAQRGQIPSYPQLFTWLGYSPLWHAPSTGLTAGSCEHFSTGLEFGIGGQAAHAARLMDCEP